MDKSTTVNGVYVPRSVNAEFRDTITDISYDHFGHRLALSSTDHTIQIWDLSQDGTYQLTSKFRSHQGSVWKVTWAHPEFGQILATCSLDRTAVIWEEVLDTTTDTKRSSNQTSHWAKRASLVDSRTSLTDIRFAPKHLGLMLVTCAMDGHIRVYEAPDITNLNHWSLRDEFNCKMACSSITWNQSRIHPPMLAVGSDDANNPSPKVLIYEYDEHLRRWIKADAIASATDPVHDLSFAPYIGRSYHLLGIASKNVQIVTIKPTMNPTIQTNLSTTTTSSTQHQQQQQASSLAAAAAATNISTNANNSNILSTTTTSATNLNITANNTSTQNIVATHDTSHSSSTIDHHHHQSHLHHQHHPHQQSRPHSQAQSLPKYDIRTVAQFDDHLSQVWRVSWNITGTILASSGDDGTVRMWKSNYLDNWKALGVLNDTDECARSIE